MPAVRSFFALSVLAACLAQASAGPNMGGDSGSSWGNGGGSGGQYGSGGSGGGQGGSWGGNNYNQYSSSWEAAPTTAVQAQSCPPMSCPPPMTSTMTETTTVTAVSPCTGSTVTAYVTQWMNAPPGCWCGAGSPPPMASGWEWGGMGDAAIFTSTNPSFTPGLSSIPASEAVKTGVTVAGAPPAAAPTAAVSPGGFFGESSSSAMTTSGTETSGPSSSVPSNMAEPTKTGEAPQPEASSSTTSASSSSAATSSTSTTTTTTSSKSSSSTSMTITTMSSSSESSASAEAASATSGGFPVGSFNTIDPATLTLKNAYTLGIGRRAPVPTLLS